MEIICKEERELNAHPQDLRVRSMYEIISKDLWLDVLVGHSCFYNSWVISRALIGRQLRSIRVQTMEMTSWWRNLFFSFSRARFSQRPQQKWTTKLSMLFWKTNRQQFSTVCSLIDIEVTSKCSKLCSETACLRPVVPLAFWPFWRHWLRSITVQTIEDCCRFFNSVTLMLLSSCVFYFKM